LTPRIIWPFGDLSQAVRAALGDVPLPDELTREIAVTVGDAA